VVPGVPNTVVVIVIGGLDAGEDLAVRGIKRVDESGLFVSGVDPGWGVNRFVDIGEEGMGTFGDSQDAAGGVDAKGVGTLGVDGERGNK
jgi:hypothetical protein